MAIHVMENYMAVEKYAAICGVKRRTVMDRIKSNLISAIKVDGYYAVNTQVSPPQKYIHWAWKKAGGGVNHTMPDLRLVVRWCHGKNLRSYPYLRAIIIGEIEGWVIGGEIFARAADLETFRKNRS